MRIDRSRAKATLKAALAIGAGIVTFVICLAVSLRLPMTVPLRPGFRDMRQGFYSLERGRDGLFVWTAPHAEFTIPQLDRRIDWQVMLDTRISRPSGVAMPRVRVAIDGATVAEQTARRRLTIDVSAPRRADGSGITVSIDTTPAYAPGRDRRQLGVALTEIRLRPVGGVPRIPWRAIASSAAAIIVLGFSVAAAGAPVAFVAGFSGVVGGAQAVFVARGVAPYLQYASHALALALGLAAAFVAVVWSVERFTRQRLSSAAVCAAAVSLAACYLKLLLLLHPDMPIGDGLFHAHRLEYVLAGRLFFTSLTPHNYAFPYPVFLYVLSAPFAWLTSDSLDRLALLRVVVTIFDAAAAVLVYWMIVRATSDRVAGIAGIVWYHVVPMTAWMMTEGALTNAFAQTLFVATLALVVALPIDMAKRSTIAALTLTCAAALLSHPSTCAILLVVLAAASAIYAWHGGPLRPAAFGVVTAAVASAVIAFAVYYAWFPSVYVSELGRAASASAVGATPEGSFGTRLTRAVSLGEIYFGWPALAAALIGAWHLARTRLSARLNLLLLAWAGTCLVFLVVGIVTPIEMRYHFAAFPAVAIAAAFACSWAWSKRVGGRVVLCALVAAGLWDGISQWLWALSTYARVVR